MDMKTFIEKHRDNKEARAIAWALSDFLKANRLKHPNASYNDFVVAVSFVTETCLINDIDRENLRELLIASHKENTKICNEMKVIP